MWLTPCCALQRQKDACGASSVARPKNLIFFVASLKLWESIQLFTWSDGRISAWPYQRAAPAPLRCGKWPEELHCPRLVCPHLLPEHPWVHKHPDCDRGILLGKMIMNGNGTCCTSVICHLPGKICAPVVLWSHTQIVWNERHPGSLTWIYQCVIMRWLWLLE